MLWPDDAQGAPRAPLPLWPCRRRILQWRRRAIPPVAPKHVRADRRELRHPGRHDPRAARRYYRVGRGRRVGFPVVRPSRLFFLGHRYSAHTLGRCEAQNSGFQGGWTGYQSSFSNNFYQVRGRGDGARAGGTVILPSHTRPLFLERCAGSRWAGVGESGIASRPAGLPSTLTRELGGARPAAYAAPLPVRPHRTTRTFP